MNLVEANNDGRNSYGWCIISSDGSFGWLAKGSALEVFNLKSGHRIAAWCFGALIKDPETLITAVCEYENDRCATSQLVVASTTLNVRIPGGVICVFDVHRSAVVRAIQFPHEVRFVWQCNEAKNAVLLYKHCSALL